MALFVLLLTLNLKKMHLPVNVSSKLLVPHLMHSLTGFILLLPTDLSLAGFSKN